MGKLDFYKVSHFTLKPRKMVKFKIFLSLCYLMVRLDIVYSLPILGNFV